MIYRQRASQAVSAWIRDGRGAYTHGGKTVCRGFHLYRGFVGCPAWAAGENCSYCFLRSTFNDARDPELRKGVAWVGPSGYYPTDEDPAAKILLRRLGSDTPALDNARAALRKWLRRKNACPVCRGYGAFRRSSGQLVECVGCLNATRPQLLNAGETSDTLGFPPAENPHVGMLLDLFSSPDTNPHGHKVLFVTKAGLEAVKAHLEGRQPSDNVILSFSVGNMGAQEPFWANVFAPMGRVWAGFNLAREGWRVRLRLDPLGAGHDWQADVEQFSTTAAASFTDPERQPELITLGTLRHRGGRVKLPAEERASIYRSAIEGLRGGGYEGEIGFCKEEPHMIRGVLGIEPGEMKCNCVP